MTDPRAIPNTFGVAATAAEVLVVSQSDDIERHLSDGRAKPLVLGDGSNILVIGDVATNVLLMRTKTIRIIDEAATAVTLQVDAGYSWDDLVTWAGDRELWGIENLALIPGRSGAAPIQNIGAYGAQLSDVLVSASVWNVAKESRQTLDPDALELGYRTSVLRRCPGEYLVESITIRLNRHAQPKLEYPGIQEALGNIKNPLPVDVASAVRNVRRSKLPDPRQVGNAGSFFKNPKITNEKWESLRLTEKNVVGYPSEAATIKLSAARLVDLCGWKGHREGDAGVSDQHALVLVNHGSATGDQIWNIAQRIKSSVLERFGVELEPEPTVIGADAAT